MKTPALRLLVLGAAIAWAVGLRIAVSRLGNRAARGNVAADDGAAKLGRTLAARVPPLEAPANTVRRADAWSLRPTQLVALARAHRSIELGDALEGVAEATGFEDEQKVKASFRALGFVDAPVLDGWVLGSPESPVAHVARAAAQLDVVRRATPSSCDASGRRITSEENRALIVSARNDLERALQLRATLLVAHTLLAESYVLEGTPVPRAALDRALEVCAACLGPREEYLLGLRPDRTAMRDFAEESRPITEDNPRLRALLGEVEAEDCARLETAGRHREAEEACDRAIGEYPLARFLTLKSRVLYSMGRFPETVEALTRALAEDPVDTHALVERARAYGELDDFEKAAPDLRLALELDPTNRTASDLFAWAVNRLEYHGKRAARRGDLNDALDAYDSAARVVPEHAAFAEARDAIAMRLGGPSARVVR